MHMLVLKKFVTCLRSSKSSYYLIQHIVTFQFHIKIFVTVDLKMVTNSTIRPSFIQTLSRTK